MAKRVVLAGLLSGLMAATLCAAQTASDLPRDPAAPGYLNLHKRHPDGAEGRVEFDSYSSAQALGRLDQMRGMLESFRRLTDQARRRLDGAQLKAIGNTDRTTQTIGFHNLPLIVEATILKQEYQLAQARYELARLKYDRQQVSAPELARMRSAYQEATRKLQTFWDTKRPMD